MTAPYACHNLPRPQPGDTYPMQDGWTPDGRRKMTTWPVLPSAAQCLYDAKVTDERCAGCIWIV